VDHRSRFPLHRARLPGAADCGGAVGQRPRARRPRAPDGRSKRSGSRGGACLVAGVGGHCWRDARPVVVRVARRAVGRLGRSPARARRDHDRRRGPRRLGVQVGVVEPDAGRQRQHAGHDRGGRAVDRVAGRCRLFHHDQNGSVPATDRRRRSECDRRRRRPQRRAGHDDPAAMDRRTRGRVRRRAAGGGDAARREPAGAACERFADSRGAARAPRPHAGACRGALVRPRAPAGGVDALAATA
jgi:hypothetical protein